MAQTVAIAGRTAFSARRYGYENRASERRSFAVYDPTRPTSSPSASSLIYMRSPGRLGAGVR